MLKERKIKMVRITDVLPHSRAEKAGIAPEDILISINGKEIRDVLDYRFYLAEKKIKLIFKRGEELMETVIIKKEYDDIGLDFETPLMDKKRSCENKCVFCFIDQLPSGMRETLYFKDDDSRLSFLHGNYVTLTNMRDADIDRIIDMHISPVNVSVHTTNPELRCKMMHNKRAGEVLSYLRRFADANINICAQIVLCKGINDGSELDRTLHDLMELRPALQSVAIVPSGLTKFRDGLYPLDAFTKEDARAVISQINTYGEWCLSQFGTRLFFPADEFYIKAELPLPSDEFYEDYSQIENGVGMLTDMQTCIDTELEDISPYADFSAPRCVSIATGYAAYEHICTIAKKLENAFCGLKIHVYKIKNDFFGDSITVAGLLTATDLTAQLADKDLGDALLIPTTALRADGEVFLDDITPDELSKRLSVEVLPTSSDATEFIYNVLGL
jgi:putative radical SAM enzyme (TIGR03279 family)